MRPPQNPPALNPHLPLLPMNPQESITTNLKENPKVSNRLLIQIRLVHLLVAAPRKRPPNIVVINTIGISKSITRRKSDVNSVSVI